MIKGISTTNLTDYKIRSVKIYRSTLLALSFVIALLLLAELILDLKGTSETILIPALSAILFIFFLSFFRPALSLDKWVFIAVTYLAVQINFLYHPTFYHTLIYWFSFVPLIALIISGVRVSAMWLSFTIISLIIDFIYMNQNFGTSYTVEILNRPVLASGVIFAAAIMFNAYLLYYLIGAAYERAKQKSTEVMQIKDKTEFKKKLLENYMKEFVKFSREDSYFKHSQTHLFLKICETIANNIGITRVSIWFFDEHDTLNRKCLFELNKGTNSDEIAILNRSDNPEYFNALANQPYILAYDARTDERTKRFTNTYLKAFDIYSLLDCPIFMDQKLVGVICCENQSKVKRWNTEDALFVQSFADLIAMNYKNQRIELLVDELKKTNEQLRIKNKEIELMNVALDSTVQQRTQVLKSQNEKLSEYSFINSHLLRAPLSRILGLSQAIGEEATTIKDKQLIKALIESGVELDTIIRKINDILYTGRGPSRGDLISIEKDIKNGKKNRPSISQKKKLKKE